MPRHTGLVAAGVLGYEAPERGGADQLIRYVWVIVGVGAGCNGWPRFDHLPGGEFVPTEPLRVDLEIVGDESRDGDRPEQPLELDGPLSTLGELNEGVVWRGGLGWLPALGVGEETFECPIDPLPLTYPADVDFVRFAHQGGSLCVTAATELTGIARPGDEGGDERYDCPDGVTRPLWDAPLYELADDGCVVGNWLNEPDGIFPTAIGLRNAGLFFANLPPGDYALLLAAVCGRYEGAEPCDETFADEARVECVPYSLAVAVVPSQAACDALNEQLLREAL